MSGGSKMKLNWVFYANTYHPIQAGSIDGTDTVPHDNAVSRALLCSSASLYDPFGDPKVIGDPYCTVFVGRLSHLTTEHTLLKAMSKYGRVKNLCLVRHIVTGASRGYGFVEYETERDMRRAYKDAHHSYIDDSEIIVDYCRQLLMPGWVPRRLGGGLGGRKESGQLRFGGRERPFRAPLQQIPHDDLKRLGIPPPPEGRYMSRFEVPSPPRRKQISSDREEDYAKGSPMNKEHRKRSGSIEKRKYEKGTYDDKEEPCDRRRSVEREERHCKQRSMDRPERSHDTISLEREDRSWKRSHADQEKHYERSYVDEEESSWERSSRNREGGSQKHHGNGSRYKRHSGRRSASRDHSSDHHGR